MRLGIGEREITDSNESYSSDSDAEYAHSDFSLTDLDEESYLKEKDVGVSDALSDMLQVLEGNIKKLKVEKKPSEKFQRRNTISRFSHRELVANQDLAEKIRVNYMHGVKRVFSVMSRESKKI